MTARRRADREPSRAELPDFRKKGSQVRHVRLTGLTASACVKTQHRRASTDQLGELDQIAVHIAKRERRSKSAGLEGMVEELQVHQADRRRWGTIRLQVE